MPKIASPRPVWLFFLTVVMGIFLAAGCSSNQYVIELTPDGHVMQRKLTVWHEQTDNNSTTISALPDEELRRIGTRYDKQQADADGEKRIFTGRFRESMPDDVGGAGGYHYFESPLGSWSYYSERFRGSDDAKAELERREAAADELVDILINWLKLEVRDRPTYDQLHQLLDKEVRRDVKNLGIFFWNRGGLNPQENKSDDEGLCRMVQYLVERDYLSIKEIPHIHRTFSEEDPKKMAIFFQRIIARKIGVENGKPIPESLAFLANPDHVSASLQKYLRSTKFYKKKLDEWKKDPKNETDKSPPKPMDFFTMLAVEAVVGSIWHSGDFVTVRLRCSHEPFATNGKWEAEPRVVAWSNVGMKDNHSAPTFVYAAWSTPDRKAQTKHFGRVMLQGQNLRSYVTWYNGLSPKETDEWDRLIAGLQAGPTLRRQLKALRFAGDAKLAKSPVKLILDQLAKPAPSK